MLFWAIGKRTHTSFFFSKNMKSIIIRDAIRTALFSGVADAGKVLEPYQDKREKNKQTHKMVTKHATGEIHKLPGVIIGWMWGCPRNGHNTLEIMGGR